MELMETSTTKSALVSKLKTVGFVSVAAGPKRNIAETPHKQPDKTLDTASEPMNESVAKSKQALVSKLKTAGLVSVATVPKRTEDKQPDTKLAGAEEFQVEKSQTRAAILSKLKTAGHVSLATTSKKQNSNRTQEVESLETVDTHEVEHAEEVLVPSKLAAKFKSAGNASLFVSSKRHHEEPPEEMEAQKMDVPVVKNSNSNEELISKFRVAVFVVLACLNKKKQYEEEEDEELREHSEQEQAMEEKTLQNPIRSSFSPDMYQEHQSLPTVPTETQILRTLGLTSRPLTPSVKSIEPPQWLQDGWKMIAMAERKPPMQALTFLDHAVRNLGRQVEQQLGFRVSGMCPHGFSDAEYHGRHCIAVELLVSNRKLQRLSHKKSFYEYQKILFQRLCECAKKCHHPDRAIALGKHHLELAKETKDTRAEIVAQRNLALAYSSKRATCPAGSRHNNSAWDASRESTKYMARSQTLSSSMQVVSMLSKTEAGRAALLERSHSEFVSVKQNTAKQIAEQRQSFKKQMRANFLSQSVDGLLLKPPPGSSDNSSDGRGIVSQSLPNFRGAIAESETEAEYPNLELMKDNDVQSTHKETEVEEEEKDKEEVSQLEAVVAEEVEDRNKPTEDNMLSENVAKEVDTQSGVSVDVDLSSNTGGAATGSEKVTEPKVELVKGKAASSKQSQDHEEGTEGMSTLARLTKMAAQSKDEDSSDMSEPSNLGDIDYDDIAVDEIENM